MKKYKFEINEYNCKRWYWEDKLHRGNDLPAEILVNGTKWWHWEGLIHRENDLPAHISVNSEFKSYWKNGDLVDK
jgi:hypothetical protein